MGTKAAGCTAALGRVPAETAEVGTKAAGRTEALGRVPAETAEVGTKAAGRTEALKQALSATPSPRSGEEMLARRVRQRGGAAVNSSPEVY